MTWKTALTLSILTLTMSLFSCANRPACKVTKPRPYKMLATGASVDTDNGFWHCVPLGLDAKTKRTTYVCTSKADGSRVMVTPIL